MQAAIAHLRTRMLEQAERRLPALTRLREPEVLPLRLDRRRIYVLPSGFGVAFALLLVVMLVGALNYGNNPAILLTCLLGATCGASLFFGFRMLSGLRLASVRAGEAHAGDIVALRLRFSADGRSRHALRLRSGATDVVFAVPARDDADVALPLQVMRRGWYRPGRMRLWTDYPLGLFQAWSWIHPAAAFLVYPAVETHAPPLPGGVGEHGERAHAGASEDHSGLRDYRASDASRLIAWKASVRHDSLLVRDAEHRSGETLVLEYSGMGGLDHESRISRLAAWVLAAETEQRRYQLRVPGDTLGPGLGIAHRLDCLRALALLPDANGAAV
jgi:uncharacterized protein (DUF58 family)